MAVKYPSENPLTLYDYYLDNNEALMAWSSIVKLVPSLAPQLLGLVFGKGKFSVWISIETKQEVDYFETTLQTMGIEILSSPQFTNQIH